MLKINKIFSCKHNNLFFAALAIGFFGLISLPAVLSAQSVLQGYGSDEDLQKGMLIAIKEGDSKKIVAVTDKNVSKFKGVVVNKNDSPVTISGIDDKYFVASTGPYEVLVSDENGPIKKGNFIGISTSSGIGAKALESQEFVVGVAITDFAGGGDAISSKGTDKTGKANIGRISVDVSLGKNPNLKLPAKDKIPDAIQKLSRAIADKPVSNVRILISLAIFTGTTIIAGTMLYSGVRNTMISIGRNPLSKASIYRGLLQVVVMVVIIFLIGIFGVYLILKL